MDKGREVSLDHVVHPLHENSVLRFEEFMSRVGPLLDRFFYQSSSYDEGIIIWELACLGSVFVIRS